MQYQKRDFKSTPLNWSLENFRILRILIQFLRNLKYILHVYHWNSWRTGKYISSLIFFTMYISISWCHSSRKSQDSSRDTYRNSLQELKTNTCVHKLIRTYNDFEILYSVVFQCASTYPTEIFFLIAFHYAEQPTYSLRWFSIIYKATNIDLFWCDDFAIMK